VAVIALDTSHPTGSVSAARRGDAPVTVIFGEDASHLAGIGAASRRALERAGLVLEDVERVAVAIGPGSFTGLRIGLAFAKGLVASRDVALVAVSTLELIALPHLEPGVGVAPMIDARRGEVYAALYERTTRGEIVARVEPRAVAAPSFLEAVGGAEGSVGTVVCVGTGALRYRDAVSELDGATIAGGSPLPSTAALAAVAFDREPVPAAEVVALEPTYLRPSGAQRKRLRPIDP
jgi:tRNA threonylcarbamoyladenosine biosynthesis protein TsaB